MAASHILGNVLVLVCFLGIYIVMLRLNQCSFPAVKYFLGTLAEMLFFGGLGLGFYGLTDHLVAGYMAAMVYYISAIGIRSTESVSEAVLSIFHVRRKLYGEILPVRGSGGADGGGGISAVQEEVIFRKKCKGNIGKCVVMPEQTCSVRGWEKDPRMPTRIKTEIGILH